MHNKLSADFGAMSIGAGQNRPGRDGIARSRAEASVACLSSLRSSLSRSRPESRRSAERKSEKRLARSGNRSRTSPESQRGRPAEKQRRRKALQDETGSDQKNEQEETGTAEKLRSGETENRKSKRVEAEIRRVAQPPAEEQRSAAG